MSPPRRYRLALLAYPAPFRRLRAAEMVATLADGDAARGRASWREAAALVRCGLGARGGGSPGVLLLLAATVTLVAAVAPDALWAEHTVTFATTSVTSTGSDGPQPPALRLVLAAVAVAAIGRRAPRAATLVAALLPAAFFEMARLSAGMSALPSLDRYLVGDLARVAGVGVASLLATSFLLRALRRIDTARADAGLCALSVAASAATLALTAPRLSLNDDGVAYAGSWLSDLGLASWLAAAGGMLALIALVAQLRPPERLADVLAERGRSR